MSDICKHYLKEDWERDLRCKLLGSKQSGQKFWDFYQDIMKLNIMLKDTDSHHDNKQLRNLLEAALNEDLDNHATEDKINTILDLKKWASTIDNLNMKHRNELKHICIEADELVHKHQAL
ncbi:hypothetical protein C0995_007332, partial [Termitomyces sp. Mi166